MSEYHLPKHFPVTCHTDFVGNGSTFVAIKGKQFDGVTFIPQAIERGATKIIVEHGVAVPKAIKKVIQQTCVKLERVKNARRALAVLSAQAVGNPAQKLKIIGITGTKGKTTTAFLVEHMLRVAGHKTAIISTVSNKICDYILPKDLTTPQPDYLHIFFAECVRLGVEWVVMEVSAQALTLDRVHSIEFDGIIFTNFSQEHAEFYSSQQEYFQAKCMIFKQLKRNAPCIVNADDAHYSKLPCYIDKLQSCLAVSLQQKAGSVQVTPVKSSFHDGLVFKLGNPENQITIFCPYLVGTFNIYNAAMAATLARALGVSRSAIVNACTSFEKVPGRMQRHKLANGSLAIIDYAHTPSSFESVLATLREVSNHLIVVFGAGGNRDKTKRPEMGRIAAQYGDLIIVTTDNPRDEQVEDIIDDIVQGISSEFYNNVIIEFDRELAIKKAYQLSHSKTVIALLGKGPDEYQEVKGIKVCFSEKSILESF